jgi:hypothetical protein
MVENAADRARTEVTIGDMSVAVACEITGASNSS